MVLDSLDPNDRKKPVRRDGEDDKAWLRRRQNWHGREARRKRKLEAANAPVVLTPAT